MALSKFFRGFDFFHFEVFSFRIYCFLLHFSLSSSFLLFCSIFVRKSRYKGLGGLFETNFCHVCSNLLSCWIYWPRFRYTGEWKEDKQNGKGKEVWVNGSVYEGDYFESMKHGRGVFQWSDGSTYEGEFRNNDIEGQGKHSFFSLTYFCAFSGFLTHFRSISLEGRKGVHRPVEGQQNGRQRTLRVAGWSGLRRRVQGRQQARKRNI